jgi:quercetin dioxygenase-like cupin family protein
MQTEVEVDRTKDGGRKGMVRPASRVARKQVAAGQATETQVLLGPDDGMRHFAMRRFTMGPGGGMPLHTNTVEHQQFVLRGRARVAIGSEIFEVGPEDVVYIPEGVPHSYSVVEAPFEFLCMVPNAPDHIELVDSSR